VLDHTKPYVEKIYYIDAELSGHAGYVKRQSLCGSSFSLSGVSQQRWATFHPNEDGLHFFTFKYECHNRYKKLLLRNAENGDIA